MNQRALVTVLAVCGLAVTAPACSGSTKPGDASPRSSADASAGSPTGSSSPTSGPATTAPATTAATTAPATTAPATTATTTAPADLAIEDTIMDLYANWPIEFEAPSTNHERSLQPADLDARPSTERDGEPPTTVPSAYAWIRGVARSVQINAFELESPEAATATVTAITTAPPASGEQPTPIEDDGSGWRGRSFTSPGPIPSIQACGSRVAKAYGVRAFEVIITLSFCPQGTDPAAEARLITIKQDKFLSARGIKPDSKGAGFRDGPRRYGPDDVLLALPTMFEIARIDPADASAMGKTSYNSTSLSGVAGTGTHRINWLSDGRELSLNVEQALEPFTAAEAASATGIAGSGVPGAYVETPGGFPGGRLWATAPGSEQPSVIAAFVQGNRRYWANVRGQDVSEASRVAVALATAQRERVSTLGFDDTTTNASPAPIGDPNGVKVEDLLPDLKAVWPYSPAAGTATLYLQRRATSFVVDAFEAPPYSPLASASSVAIAQSDGGGDPASRTDIVAIASIAELADRAAASSWLGAFKAPPSPTSIARPGNTVGWSPLPNVPAGWEGHLVATTIQTPPGQPTQTSLVLARAAGPRIALVIVRIIGTDGDAASQGTGVGAFASAIDEKLSGTESKPGAGDTNWKERLIAAVARK